ncbi:MAG: hypothetical protein QOE01_1230, partial [Actinomycetota bacterium]|nr:hypothetical protein [Actinomycetota bacterium]
TAVFGGLTLAALAVVGTVVALAVPGNRVGWLILAAATTMSVGAAMTEAGVQGVTGPDAVPAAASFASIGTTLRGIGWLLAVVAVPAYFPDGRLPGPRWRWVPTCLGVGLAAFGVGELTGRYVEENRLDHVPNPFAAPGAAADVATGVSFLGVVAVAVAACATVVGLVARWRAGGARVRQQVLLLSVAAVSPVVVAVAAFAADGATSWLFDLVTLTLAVAVATAVLHDGVYDVRRATNRTLVWVTLSGGVAAIYGAVVGLGAVVAPDHASVGPAAVAVAATALALLPLRGAVQRGVNRLVYGRWREPYEVLSELGSRLEAAGDVEALLGGTAAQLADLGLGRVAIRSDDGRLLVGSMPGGAVTVPLHAYGSRVGELRYDPPGHSMAEGEQRLLTDLARQLGAVLHARGLTDALQSARERLVTGREEERRRLRRDLHDGIGPALAGLTFKAETARALLPEGSPDLATRLEVLTEEIRAIVLDVRRVVEGLRPPALDELGLVAAVRQAVERVAGSSGVQVAVSAGPLTELSAAVDLAAYHIALEAVSNAVRHSCGSRALVRFEQRESSLVVTVTDDGVGLRPGGPTGNGLATMRERAAELGGRVELVPRGPGLRLVAELPIGPSRHHYPDRSSDHSSAEAPASANGDPRPAPGLAPVTGTGALGAGR